MQTTTALNLARSLMDQHGLHNWRVVIDTGAKRRLGRTRLWAREIGLSEYHVTMHTDADIRDTILHEIAHALVGHQKRPHGKEWRAMARKVGANPRATNIVNYNDEVKARLGMSTAIPVAVAATAAVSRPARVSRVVTTPRAQPAWVVGSSNWDEMWGDA